MCAALGESDAVPGVVSLAQSFGSLAHWHPHLHLVVTDGGFQRDGSFVTQAAHEAAVLAKAWRRAVLALFVREGWLEKEAASSMLAWPHSGFSAYVGPAIAAAGRAAVLRVARLVQHIPGKGEVRVRYYGAYASRRRGWWRRRGVVLAGVGQEQAHDEAERDAEREVAAWPVLKARRRRWAELLRLVFAVDIAVYRRCGGEMRIIAFVTEHSVVTRILAHLARGGVDARAGPWAAAAGKARGGRGVRMIGARRQACGPAVGGVCAARAEVCRVKASAAAGGGIRAGARERGGIRAASEVMRRVRTGEIVVAGRSGGAYARGVRGRKFLSFPNLRGRCGAGPKLWTGERMSKRKQQPGALVENVITGPDLALRNPLVFLCALVASLLILALVTFDAQDPDLWHHLAVGRYIWHNHAIPFTQIWTWPTYGEPAVCAARAEGCRAMASAAPRGGFRGGGARGVRGYCGVSGA